MMDFFARAFASAGTQTILGLVDEPFAQRSPCSPFVEFPITLSIGRLLVSRLAVNGVECGWLKWHGKTNARGVGTSGVQIWCAARRVLTQSVILIYASRNPKFVLPIWRLGKTSAPGIRAPGA